MKQEDIKLFANQKGYDCIDSNKYAEMDYLGWGVNLKIYEDDYTDIYHRGYEKAEYLAFQWLAENIDYILRFYAEGDREKVLKDFLSTMRQ